MTINSNRGGGKRGLSFRRTRLLLPAALATAALACAVLIPDAVEPTSPPPPSPSSTVEPTRPPTPTPAVSPTSTRQAIGPPSGAGLVKPPEFDVRFEPLPENADEAGFLIYFSWPAGDYPKEIAFDYVPLGGGERGELLRLTLPWVVGLGSSNNTKFPLSFAYESETREGVLLLDPRTSSVIQFDTGCSGSRFSLPSAPGAEHFAFNYCSEDSTDEAHIYHVVSTKDWSIQSYDLPSPPPGDTSWGLWITPEILVVEPMHCIIRVGQPDPECLSEVPYWWAPKTALSPDGKWVEVEYRAPDDTRQRMAGFVSLECLLDLGPDCSPLEIEEPVTLFGSAVYRFWAEDGDRLLFHVEDCHGRTETTLWEYDLEEGTSTVIRTLQDCYVPGPGPWTPDGSGILIVGRTPSSSYSVWLLPLEGGSLREVTAGIEGISEIVGVFSGR